MWAIVAGITFLFYHLSNPSPLDWYRHFVFLAQAFLEGRLDLRGVPDYYQDLVRLNGKVFMPFAPMPAVLLIPSVLISGMAASQVMVGKIVGALNVGLMWLILSKLQVEKNLKWLLVIFFGLGTVHWYAAVMGTTWFYAHVVGVMFMLLALLIFLNHGSCLLTGLLVGAAVLSREAMLGGAVFFLLVWLKGGRSLKKILNFGVGVGLMVGLLLMYNFIRFGNIWDEGYAQVVEQYRHSGYPYTILLKYWPSAPRFEFLDVRNIPLHLYTMLVMPPDIKLKPMEFKPSPYGMSLWLTSPLLLWLFGKPKREKLIWWASLAAVGVTSVPILLHFTQGWVQFGYRFALDFMPFLIIMLALREPKGKLAVAAVGWSVLINAWGIWWAQRLGW